MSGVAAESGEPEWRREVTRRLGEYRTRHHRPRTDEPQTGLPFQDTRKVIEPEVRERSRPIPSPRHRPTERLEICIQPELDFESGRDDRAHPQTALVPVASLSKRRWAILLDGCSLALTCAGFLTLFHSLGGQFTFTKTDAMLYLTMLYLFYGFYFLLFTTLSGATPGMQLLGLTVVRLDGRLPDTRQLLWRSFGYLLSGATGALGFLWAVWDEDHFTWQDRISQTYITATAPLDGDQEVGPREHSLAHK